MGPLLRELDHALATEPPSEHPDEETISLFAQGLLSGAERAELIQHLADCVECRKLASTALSVARIITGEIRTGSPSWWNTTTKRVVPFALAATVLVMASLLALVRMPGQGRALSEPQAYAQASNLLQSGQFDRARDVVSQATAQGIQSARLLNLESQAIRRMPAPVALAMAGRLSDLGYDIGGFAARGPGEPATREHAREAYEILARAGSEETTVLLNRGHALLALDRPDEALKIFRGVAARAPGESLAWLGQGLAYYAQDQFVAAEAAFRACLRLAPGNVAAKINLAMTLEEQGKRQQALDVWKSLLALPLSDNDHRQIQREVDILRRQERP